METTADNPHIEETVIEHAAAEVYDAIGYWLGIDDSFDEYRDRKHDAAKAAAEALAAAGLLRTPEDDERLSIS